MRNKTCGLLAAASGIVLLLPVGVLAAEPFDFDKAPGRLPKNVVPDDQRMVLAIVGLHADAATFEQLHTLAKAAKDDAAQRRLYLALASVSNPEMLMSPFGNMAPLFEAEFVPQVFWNSLPLDKMKAWIRSHVPAEMNDYTEKGMDSARFQYSQKQELVPAADAYVASRASHA